MMDDFHKRLKKAMDARHISQSELCIRTGIPKSAMSQYISGAFKPKQARTYSIAKALGVTEAWLMGYDDAPMDNDAKPESNISAVFSDHIRMIPVFESVSAGIGTYADDCIVDYMPCFIQNDAEAEHTICVKVCGNSMYPKIENGDIIQVLKQDWAENGQIAVVLIDGEDAVVKKIEYTSDTVKLISINPEWAPRIFTGSDRELLTILGVVKKVIKDV